MCRFDIHRPPAPPLLASPHLHPLLPPHPAAPRPRRPAEVAALVAGVSAAFLAFGCASRRRYEEAFQGAAAANAKDTAEWEAMRSRHAFVSMVSHGADKGVGEAGSSSLVPCPGPAAGGTSVPLLFLSSPAALMTQPPSSA